MTGLGVSVGADLEGGSAAPAMDGAVREARASVSEEGAAAERDLDDPRLRGRGLCRWREREHELGRGRGRCGRRCLRGCPARAVARGRERGKERDGKDCTGSHEWGLAQQQPHVISLDSMHDRERRQHPEPQHHQTAPGTRRSGVHP